MNHGQMHITSKSRKNFNNKVSNDYPVKQCAPVTMYLSLRSVEPQAGFPFSMSNPSHGYWSALPSVPPTIFISSFERPHSGIKCSD